MYLFRRSVYLTFLFLLLASVWLVAQSPYEFKLKRELPIITVGLGTGGIGTLLSRNTADLTLDQINSLDPLQINAFDRRAVGNNSEAARDASDIFLYGSHALPFALFAGQRVRQDGWRMPLLWLEGFVVNAGITGLIKYSARRPRPYVFNPAEELTRRQSRNARTSFLSGHTSVTSYNAFFAAQAFADYYPTSQAKTLVWIGAVTIPAVTGWLRVKGGRHYPTDVIAGYVLGAVTGILIPRLHRRKR